ncbi:MAG: prolyl oligopeptidase family serine peptidase, partial [Nevskiaceae bacterium]
MAVISRRTRPLLTAALSLVAAASLLSSGKALAAAPASQAATPASQATRGASPFTPEDLVQLARVADPRVSPDGRFVVFSVRETDMAANRGRTDLWLVETGAAAPVARRLTQQPGSDSSARWAPDGSGGYFLASRSGSSQVWFLTLAGGEAQAVTELPLDVGSFEISPRGDRIAVSLEVFPDCADLKCSSDRLAAERSKKSSGQSYDQLFVRHWDTWKDGTLSMLFTAPLGADRRAGAPVNVSAAVRGNVPSKPFGGDEDYAFSPDGMRLVFSARLADRGEAWSTNFDLYEVVADGSDAARNLTANNPAWDAQPVFLANGDLAWLAMTRPGFEADRFQIMLRSAIDGRVRALSVDWDRSVATLGTTFDGKRLLATSDDLGQVGLFEIDPVSGRRTTRLSRGQVAAFNATREGIVVEWAALDSPPDLYLLEARPRDATQPLRRLTAVNATRLQGRRLSAFEQFSFTGWNDEIVYGHVMKPHGYTPGQKYPIAFIVHGGPQVSFANQWSWRWNAQMYAGAGYGVVFIDFHGSPGYGQAFTDSISQDWGGKPLVDLQKGLEAAVNQYNWLDGDRACSLGASYGGFMQNWIAGNWPDRFRCIVNHAGIFDQRSMYYGTEELWFTEWENGGPYYAAPRIHEKFNPADYVTRWRTPMLVTHGALDYRVPYIQGLATFTALQRQGVKSRLLFFPDENHWILKPANSVQWHTAVLDWLREHLQAPGHPKAG